MTASPPSKYAKYSAWLGLAGSLILVDQVTTVVVMSMPMQPGQFQWRYGVFGVLMSRIPTLLVADLLLLAGAVISGGRIAQRVLAVIHLLLGVILLGSLGLFALDGVQLRPLLPITAREGAMWATARAVFIGLAASGFLLWTGARLLWLTRAGDTPKRLSAKPLIVASDGKA